MNYKESSTILEKVKSSNSFLLICHKSPDPDSIISCLMMKHVLEGLGKKADIYTVNQIPPIYKTLDKDKVIEFTEIDKIDFKKYDVFFTLDVSDVSRLGIDFELPKDLFQINIDHHDTIGPSDFMLKDIVCAATGEVLFYLFEDWEIKLNDEIVNLVLTSIISDSDSFQYNTNPRTFRTVARLIELGGNYDKAAVLLWRNNPPDRILFAVKMLSTLKVDKEGRFAYCALPYEEYIKFKGIYDPTRYIADGFIRTIEDTDFGIVMSERRTNELKISIRSRTEEYNVLELLESLGGGGYKTGGGAVVRDLPFEKAVERVVEAAREYSNKNR